MKTLLVTLLPVVLVVVLTRIFLRPARGGEIVSQDEHVVRLRMPQSKVYASVALTFALIPIAVLAFARYVLADALLIVAVMSPTAVGGALLWAVAARQIFLSRERIEVRGYRGVSFDWADLKEVVSEDNGSLQRVGFVGKNGQVIALDSTMEGWHGLLRVLQKFGTEHTKPMFDRALRQIGPDRPNQAL